MEKTSQSSAIVGTGFIAPVHLEALRRLNRPVRGILGSRPEKSEQAAQRLDLPVAYGSFQEVLEDPAVSTVHLTSPNRYHFEQCRDALVAGKHVICEKPLAMNSQQTRDLVQLAEKSSTVAAICYNVRFYPLCAQARQFIQEGHLGEIYHITGSYFQDWLLFDTDFNWRVMVEAGGPLRAVADIGTHWMDLIQWITGLKIESVCADLATIHPARWTATGSRETFTGKQATETTHRAVSIATEDYGSILFRGHEAHGHLSVSQVTAGRKNCLRFEIAGSKASLSWNSERPNELWIGYRDQPNQLLIRDPALMAEETLGTTDYPGGHNEGFPDTFKQLFRAIYTDIDREPGDRRKSAWPTFEEGHREVVICEGILNSHRERAWIDITG